MQRLFSWKPYFPQREKDEMMMMMMMMILLKNLVYVGLTLNHLTGA